jgi:hypothetical protein
LGFVINCAITIINKILCEGEEYEMTLDEMKNTIEEKVLCSMRDYLLKFDGEGYEIKDVNTCGLILHSFIDELSSNNKNPKEIMKCVKTVVTKLNKLNDDLEYSLIETDQREELCEFIISAVNIAGMITDEDVTEEWREW